MFMTRRRHIHRDVCARRRATIVPGVMRTVAHGSARHTGDLEREQKQRNDCRSEAAHVNSIHHPLGARLVHQRDSHSLVVAAGQEEHDREGQVREI